MVNVIADVLFIRENLVNGPPGPSPSEICQNASTIQQRGNVRFIFCLHNKHQIHPTNNFDFFFRAGDQDHSIGLDALMLTHFKECFLLTGLVDEHSSQAIASRTSLLVSESNQVTCTMKNLGRKFPAVFTCHRPLHDLYNRGSRAAVILKLLGTVMDSDSCLATKILVMSALISILESAPSADIVNEDARKIDLTAQHVL